MKKLTKFFLIFGIVFAMTLSANTLLAEEQDPQQVVIQPSEETENPEEQTNKPEVIEVQPGETVNEEGNPEDLTKTEEDDETETGEINHAGLEDKEITITEIIIDSENPDLPGETEISETIIDDGEESIDKHIFSDDELEVNPDDIKIEIDPKFTEEVSSVSAIAVDENNLRQWIIEKLDWLNLTGTKDKDIIKLKVSDKEENKGTWVIETPTISYDIKYKFGKGYYINVDNGKGDYDEIYINVITKEMEINEGVKNKEGGLDINNVELSVPEGGTSEEVTIFDPNHIENFVNGYKDTYEACEKDVYKKNMFGWTVKSDVTQEEASEGLTIENIKIKNSNDGNEADGLTAKVNSDGSVSVQTDTVGSYDVYLEGWYTQKKYVPVAGIKNYVFDSLEPTVYYREVNGAIYKIEYTPRKGYKPASTVWYKLETHSAWATFADIKVVAVETETPIYVDTYDESVVDGSREWLVVKPVDKTSEELPDGSTKIKAEIGEDKEVFFFDIDLYEQKFEGGKATGPATRIGSVGNDPDGAKKTTVTLSGKLSTPIEAGKMPIFKVVSTHKDKEEDEYTIIYPEIISKSYDETTGEWTITFEAGLFSTYAVTYDVVNKPSGYKVVNTGITETRQNTSNNYFSLIAIGVLATLIALNKKRIAR